jgi:hypothetical protein
MEFLDSAILIVMGFFCVLGFLFAIKYLGLTGKNKQKSNLKDPQIESLKQTIKTMQENWGILEVQYKKKINSLNGYINRGGISRANQQEDEEEETMDMSDYVFDKEMVRPMLKNWGMNADALENPLLQNIIMDKVKGNEEILITLGILKPKSIGNNSQPQMDSSESPKSAAEQALSQIPAGNWA